MIKYVLSGAAVSLFVASGALALPASSTVQLKNSTDVVQISNKGKGNKGHSNKNYHHHHHNYHSKNYHKYQYHNRYWEHRYSYRPHNWQTLGCIAAGPIWYCP
jgi:ABC-type Zn2+ transport system substrate-binding protein/surface adhesin